MCCPLRWSPARRATAGCALRSRRRDPGDRPQVSGWPPVETPSVNPLLRSVSEGAVAVGLVGGLVVEDALGQAVPEDFQPAVAESAEGGVVTFARGDFLVVEFPGPCTGSEATEGPLVDGVAKVVVVRQA